MRAFAFALALLGVACGGSHPSSTSPGPSAAAPDAAPLAKHDGTAGAVCGWGEEHTDDRSLPAPGECQPGLTCCYPCGIEGCDDVCMDVHGGGCPKIP